MLKILLLSVLAVAMIGVMVPNAIAQVEISDLKLKIDEIYLHDNDIADIWELNAEYEQKSSIDGLIKLYKQDFLGTSQLDDIQENCHNIEAYNSDSRHVDCIWLVVKYKEFENVDSANEHYKMIGGHRGPNIGEQPNEGYYDAEIPKQCSSDYSSYIYLVEINCRLGHFVLTFASGFDPHSHSISVISSTFDIASMWIDTRHDVVFEHIRTVQEEIKKNDTRLQIDKTTSCSDYNQKFDNLGDPILPYNFDITFPKPVYYLSYKNTNIFSGSIIPNTSLVSPSLPCVELNLFLRAYTGNYPTGTSGQYLVWTDYYLQTTTVQDDLTFSFFLDPLNMNQWSNAPAKVQLIVSPSHEITYNNKYGSMPVELKFGDLVIPSWIKNNAGWWAEGTLTDLSFIQMIQYLLDKGIISISKMESTATVQQAIPSWVKNNAGWWAEGQIDDNSFIQGIEYLVKVGIIQVS